MTPRLLIVEDNLTLRRLYIKSVRELDVVPVEATSAKAAFQLIQSEKFDVVICDIEMSDGNTMNTIRYASQVGVPVIAISASANYHNTSIVEGAAHFFHKPVPTRKLAALVEKYISTAVV